jgi:phosphate transport system substrate-binding protein
MLKSILSVATILFCSLTAPSHAQQYRIVGSGTSTISTIMQTLGFAYQAVDSSVSATYTVTSSGAGQTAALAMTSDWGGTNSIPTKAAMSALAAPFNTTRFNSLIHSGDALLASYNLPGVQTQLVIDQNTLFRIWNNEILWWNDTALQTLNPTVTFPTERIRIVYRPDTAGTTVP